MVFKVLFLAFLVAMVLFQSCSLAAPNPSKRDEDLAKSFAEFLQQDKQISAALERSNLGNGQFFTRQKRQAEEGEMDTSEQGMDEPNEKPGFFDRAAKFVMEVLQRFLKWVNQDN